MGGAVGRQGALTEVSGIYDGLLQALNFKYGSRTLLAGHHSQGPAFDANGNFLGDSGTLDIDIDKDLRVPLTMSAEQHILGQGRVGGVNILTTFQRLMKGLGTDDTDLIQGTLEDMKRGIEQLSSARAEVGTRMQNIDRAMGRHCEPSRSAPPNKSPRSRTLMPSRSSPISPATRPSSKPLSARVKRFCLKMARICSSSRLVAPLLLLLTLYSSQATASWWDEICLPLWKRVFEPGPLHRCHGVHPAPEAHLRADSPDWYRKRAAQSRG